MPTPKAKVSVFDPRELRDVRALCKDGLIPYHHKTAERFCRDGDMAAIKVGTHWKTTESAARSFPWKRANPAFRKVHC